MLATTNPWAWAMGGFTVLFVLLAFPGLMHVVFRHGHRPEDQEDQP